MRCCKRILICPNAAGIDLIPARRHGRHGSHINDVEDLLSCSCAKLLIDYLTNYYNT